MSAAKKAMRAKFNSDCLKRDKYACVICGNKSNPETGLDVPLEVHHITNRNDMPNGGYVKENGITVCGPCHYHVERGIMTPYTLYTMISSSYEKALSASERLKNEH